MDATDPGPEPCGRNHRPHDRADEKPGGGLPSGFRAVVHLKTKEPFQASKRYTSLRPVRTIWQGSHTGGKSKLFAVTVKDCKGTLPRLSVARRSTLKLPVWPATAELGAMGGQLAKTGGVSLALVAVPPWPQSRPGLSLKVNNPCTSGRCP